jgi:hypothetical protein
MDFIKIKKPTGCVFLKIEEIVEVSKALTDDKFKSSYLATREGDIVNITREQADQLINFITARTNILIEI